MSAQTTPLRRAIMWGFAPPATAHICLNGSIDFSESLRYLGALKVRLPGITIQHLLVAAVGRVLGEYPAANARVVRGRIVPADQVGVCMPVNLLGHPGGKRQELGVAVVGGVDRMSLCEVARACASKVGSEREGRGLNALMATLWKVAERAPPGVLEGGLSLAMRALASRRVLRAAQRNFPATTLMSNPGSVLGNEVGDGMLFRSASFFVPARINMLGTLWATSFVQDEVVPIDGKPEVRPMLPIVFMFDHRLIDGIIAGRVFARFGQILRDPVTEFGEKGERLAQ